MLETAEKLGIPIHILRKGSSDEIIRFLGKIKEKSKIIKPDFNLDSESKEQ